MSANRTVGSPRAVRQAEAERGRGLQQLKCQIEASEAAHQMEAQVQARVDRLRDQRARDQAKSAVEHAHAHEGAASRVENMDVERLKQYEQQQYSEMADLDAEIRNLAAKEQDLMLSDRVDHASKRAVAAGVARPEASTNSDDSGTLSRKQRLERLVAERSARQEVIRRQKEHLLAERTNIESELRSIQHGEAITGGASHADTVDKILMTRHGGGGHTFKEQNNAQIKVPGNASGNTQMMVNQLASRYHEDRRRLQMLREQQVQLQKEIESTRFSAWKPSALDEAQDDGKSQIDAQMQARTEFARQVKFEQSKRDLAQTFGQPIAEADPVAPAPASDAAVPPHSTLTHQSPSQPPAPVFAREPPAARDPGFPAARPAPASTGNALLDEIQMLKHDYMSRGGKDSAMLEAIVALERQAALPQARAWGGGMQDAAQMAGARAVQAVYSNQWAGPPGGYYAGAGHAMHNLPPYMPMQSTNDHTMRNMQDEIAKLDAAIEERQLSNKQLAQQLQLDGLARTAAPPTKAMDSSAQPARGADTAAQGPGRQLTEEEEELMQMERNPNDTDLYRLRKKHLKEMIALKYDIQRLQQETAKDELEQQVEMMKKEHERREWVLKQQQLLLEAKYRKHMAREKPFTNVSGQSDSSKPKDAADYSPEVGFHMYVDYILGLPSKVNNQVQIVYGFYEGMTAKTDAKSMPLCGVENDGASLRSVVAVKRSFLKVFNNDKFKVLIELQSVTPASVDRGPRTMPVGWTMLRLFEEDGSFNRGLWRMPLFLPPVRPDFAPEDLVNVHRIKGLEMFMRLVPGQQGDVHDRFSINPDMTQMQYKYPAELRLKAPEKRVAAPAVEQGAAPQVPAPDLQGPVPPLQIPGLPGPVAAHAPAHPAAFLAGESHSLQGSAPPGSIMPANVGLPARLEVHVHDITGSLFGHGHCQEPGPVFVRISLVVLSTGQLINTTIGAHINPAVHSPGLRVMEQSEDDEEEEEVLKQVQGSWCTSGVLGGDPSNVVVGQGCALETVPCSLNTGLLVELYREHEGPREDSVAPLTLRQNPDEESTFIAWAVIPLFVKSTGNELQPEGEEMSDWTKAGLRALTGVQEKELLAPPISHGSDYNTVRLQQSKYADVLSCDGLATSAGGATVILNAPLPTLRVTIEAAPRKAIEKLQAIGQHIAIAGHLQKGAGKSKPDTIFKYTDKEAWIACPDPPVGQELFAADDGFDVYIDGARWLPDNVILTKVTCYVANAKMQLYGKFEKEVDPRSMNVRCPYYLARKEMRRDPSKEWDPTLTLLIEINGLEGNPADHVKSERDWKREAGKADKDKAAGAVRDTDSSQHPSGAPTLPCVIVGFAVLHIFVDPISHVQPANSEVREYVLNEGSFQVSVHRSGLKEKEDLSARALDDELKRLCTTLLVRIVKAPRSADGTKVMSVKDHPGVDESELEELNLLVPPRPYQTGGYASSSFSVPSAIEQVIYAQRLKAQSLKMFSAAETVMGMLGAKLTIQEEEAVKNSVVFESERFDETLKTLRGHIKKMFKGNPATRVLDPRLGVSYQPEQGFLVAVDGIDNMSQDYFAVWTGALCSTLPQALFYNTNGDVGTDVTLSYQMDFQADASSPRWTDGWMWYRHRDGSKGRLLAIIDVRMAITEVKVGRKMKKLKNRQVVQLGFAFLPVIGPAGNYVMSGNYRLPLYAMGAKPPPLELDVADQLKEAPLGPSPQLLERLEMLHASSHINTALDQAVKDHDIHLVPGTSVVCRLVDRSVPASHLLLLAHRQLLHHACVPFSDVCGILISSQHACNAALAQQLPQAAHALALTDRFRYGEHSRPFIVEAGPAKVDTSCLPAGVEAKYKPTPLKLPLQKKLKDSVGSFSAHNGLMLEFFKTTLKLPPAITERPSSPRNEIDVSLGGGGDAATAKQQERAGATPMGTTPQKSPARKLLSTHRTAAATSRPPAPAATSQASQPAASSRAAPPAAQASARA